MESGLLCAKCALFGALASVTGKFAFDTEQTELVVGWLGALWPCTAELRAMLLWPVRGLLIAGVLLLNSAMLGYLVSGGMNCLFTFAACETAPNLRAEHAKPTHLYTYIPASPKGQVYAGLGYD